MDVPHARYCIVKFDSDPEEVDYIVADVAGDLDITAVYEDKGGELVFLDVASDEAAEVMRLLGVAAKAVLA